MGLLIENCRLAGGVLGSAYIEDQIVTSTSDGPTQQVPTGTYRIDAGGSTLFPGFIDSHCHPFEYGRSKRHLDLRGVSNLTGLRMRLAARVQSAQPGEWIQGRGWDQEALTEGRMPARSDIDDISGGNPVVLTRVCGHIALLNGVALSKLSLGDRQGPEYDRDEARGLTGIVRERALDEVNFSIPEESPDMTFSDLLSFELEATRNGLTAVHCIVSPENYAEELAALARCVSEVQRGLRYRIYVPPEAVSFVEEGRLRDRFAGNRAKINGVKIYADGSLGARTAALREPYQDEPGNSGILRYQDEELAGLVGKCDALGYQVIVHAIGDRAVEQAIDALEAAAGGGNPRRHRIEHASLVPRDLRGRLRKHGIRAAVQPGFIISDFWALSRLGAERVMDLYPLRSILEEGIVASGGSDAPVESLNPLLGMWAAMTRGPIAPDQKLGLRQAFDLYTTNAAQNGLDADPSPQEGSPANFTILDAETEGMHPALLRNLKVAASISMGTVTYSFEGGS